MERIKPLLPALLLLTLITVACSAPETTSPTDTAAITSPTAPPTVTAPVTDSPLPTPTKQPTATPPPSPTPPALQLVILHTNDNWGETEPCG